MIRYLALFPCLSLAACLTDDVPPETAPGPQGLAVVNSDYMSTSISLVDPATESVSRDNCINSGTKAPMLSLALSGDVVLPTQPLPDHELLLIDRANSALTLVDTATCSVLRQVAVGTGFAANPHDVTAVTATKAYVTRFDRNASPTAAPGDLDEGDDLLIVDLSTAALRGRIDLSTLAVPVAGKTIVAHPDRAILADGKVYVSLGSFSADLSYGHGRLAVVDPVTDAVVGSIDLPANLKGCSSLDYVDAVKTVYVACGGSFSDAVQADGAGIVAVDVAVSPPAIKVLPASAFGGPVPSGFNLAMLSAGIGLGATNGDFSGTPPDQLWIFDVAGGSATKLVDGSGAFVLGGPVVDAGAKRAYVADAAKMMPLVHVLDISDTAAVVVVRSFTSSPSTGLPPRIIAWY